MTLFFLVLVPFVEAHASLIDYQQITAGTIVFSDGSQNKSSQPALSTHVTMDISGVINRVHVEQTFTNSTSEWQEAVYVFPLPDNAAVDELNIKIGKRVIQGVIKEKGVARKMYEQAKIEGKKASLLEQQRANIFTSKITNIAPGESIKVVIAYQQPVLIKDNIFSIRFPMTVSERYIPGVTIESAINGVGVHANTHIVPDASMITPPKSEQANRPINISINLNAGFKTHFVQSSYHKIKIDHANGFNKQITLANNTQADKDFELTWAAEPGHTAEVAVFTESKGDKSYLLLMATPPKESFYTHHHLAREVVFVIDTSGSMHGQSLQHASAALSQSIRDLAPQDRFNIISFSTSFKPLFKRALTANGQNKKAAINFISNLNASGGTEPLDALKYAFATRDTQSINYLRQVIFLTDGQVGNEDDLLRVIKKSINHDRLFTIAIGSSPNAYLMKRLAVYGNGSFTFIGKMSEVKEKMQYLLKKLQSPVLTHIQINSAGMNLSEAAHSAIPDLYQGELISAVFKMNQLPKKIEITGKTPFGIFSKHIKIQATNESKGIHKLWAREKIESLTDVLRQRYTPAEKKAIRQSITQLALDASLVSKFTSLVAIDRLITRESGKALYTEAITSKVSAPATATNSLLWSVLGFITLLLSAGIRYWEVR